MESRGRAVRSAAAPKLERLERSAAGARGGGTARCHAAAPGGRTRPVARLPCVAAPLLALPGAARRAAAGPGGPRDRAARGGSAARLLHAGCSRASTNAGRYRLRGWDGKGHACHVPTEEVARLSHLITTMFLSSHLFVHTLLHTLIVVIFFLDADANFIRLLQVDV